MKKILIVLLVAAMFLFGTFSAAMATRVLSEKRITTAIESQGDPAIYGDIVVWAEYRNDDSDIYGYNLRTGQEFFIYEEDGKEQHSPAIYGDIVVFVGGGEGDANIYGYNLRTSQEFPICTEDEGQDDPDIYGDIVVWEDYRDDTWDIYGYNLKTGQEFPICTEEEGQDDPAIYCNKVVWEDSRIEDSEDDIYLAYIDVVCETVKKSLPMDWFMKHFGLGKFKE